MNPLQCCKKTKSIQEKYKEDHQMTPSAAYLYFHMLIENVEYLPTSSHQRKLMKDSVDLLLTMIEVNLECHLQVIEEVLTCLLILIEGILVFLKGEAQDTQVTVLTEKTSSLKRNTIVLRGLQV